MGAAAPDTLLVTALAAGVLFIAGLPVARLLLPRRWQVHTPLVAPLLGFSLLSAVAHALNAGGLGVERFAVPLLVTLALAAGTTLPWLARSCTRVLRRNLAPLALVVAVLLVSLVPMLHSDTLTTVGRTIDAISYVTRAEAVADGPLSGPLSDPERPATSWAAAPMRAGMRMGDVYVLALLASYSGLRPYQLFTPLAALFFALTVGTAFAFSRVTLRLRPGYALLAAALVGSSNLLLWCVYDDFLSQVVGTCLLPLVLGLAVDAVRRRSWRPIPAAALALAGLVSVYFVYALEVGAAVSIVAAVTMWRSRDHRWWPLIAGLASFITAIAINPIAWWRAWEEIQRVQSAAAKSGGNILIFPHPGELFGLVNHARVAHALDLPHLPGALATLGTIVAAILVVRGLLLLGPLARVSHAAFLAVSATMVIGQRFLVNWPNGYPYGYFKALAPLVIATAPLLVVGSLGILSARRRDTSHHRVARIAGVAFLASLLAIGVGNSMLTVGFAQRALFVADGATVEAGNLVSALPRDTVVLLDVPPGLLQNWLGCLATGVRIRFAQPLALYPIRTKTNGTPPHFRLVTDGRSAKVRPGEEWHRVNRSPGYSLYYRPPNLTGALDVDPPREILPGAALEVSCTAHEIHLTQDGAQPLVMELERGAKVLRLTVASPAASPRVTVGNRSVVIPPGVASLTVPLDQQHPLKVRNQSAESLWYLAASAVTAEDRPAVTGREALPAAFASVSRERSVFSVNAVVVTPDTGGAPPPYRLGLHIHPDAKTGSGVFGAWGVDLPRRAGRHVIVLRVNLLTGAAEATLDDHVTKIQGGPVSIRDGSFHSQIVLWDLRGARNLAAASVLRFARAGGSLQELSLSEPGMLQFD